MRPYPRRAASGPKISSSKLSKLGHEGRRRHREESGVSSVEIFHCTPAIVLRLGVSKCVRLLPSETSSLLLRISKNRRGLLSRARKSTPRAATSGHSPTAKRSPQRDTHETSITARGSHSSSWRIKTDRGRIEGARRAPGARRREEKRRWRRGSELLSASIPACGRGTTGAPRGQKVQNAGHWANQARRRCALCSRPVGVQACR